MNSKESIHLFVYLKKISFLEKSVRLATFGCMPTASLPSLFGDYPLCLPWPSGKQRNWFNINQRMK